MDPRPILRRMYKYRIYPTEKQRTALEAQLAFACDLYNAALEQRRCAWRQGRRTTYPDQCRDLTELRHTVAFPLRMSCAAMRDPLRRLEKGFQAFYRRVQSGEKPGYPRFRSRRRYDSLTVDEAWSLQTGRLVLQGIGHLKVKWHRSLPPLARICTVTVHRVAGRWYACFALALEASPHTVSRPRSAVGIDLGIKNFAALSTGELLLGPRAYRSLARRLCLAQRRWARRVSGSRRHRKAAALLARIHDRIRNSRLNHAHQLSRRLVTDFDFIAVEDLPIHRMNRGSFAKDINDQGWAQFVRLLGYKAEDAGVKVPPRGTSVVCSGCLRPVKKTLHERTHRCLACGLVIDRDVNAARNILRLGMSRQASTWPKGRA